jgi:molybdenum cofactor cytidylyltransferase
MNEVVAILLAAGRSRRMGAFKPLLPFGKKTVVGTCVDSLLDAGIKDITVVTGSRAEDLRGHLKDRRVRFVLNPDPDSEMGVSIACGVGQVKEDSKAVMIALVDHPAVPSNVIVKIVTQWRHGAKLIQPEHNGRGGHPVLIDLAYRDELLNLAPERGLRGLFDAHRGEVLRLAVDSPYVARDMDTWEDYQRLHQEIFGVLPKDT